MGFNTLVLGATPNTTRYAFMAAEMLTAYGHEVFPVGIKQGVVAGKAIEKKFPGPEAGIHTITLYIGPPHQPEWYDAILHSGARRIIFNPGTENEALQELAEAAGIETIEACTLVMLRTGQYES
jgi:predicted CoA-binding protein